MSDSVIATRAVAESGLLVLDKPAGITSSQLVDRARRLLGTRKIGHAGTLDPMATGVMVLGVNRATRILGHLILVDKSYTATVRLGQATITDDAEGVVTSHADAGHLSDDQIAAAASRFRGTIVQVPAAVSAIKINGQRSYARVRKGETVELTGRTVTIHRLDITAINRTTVDDQVVVDVDITVDCSSGTYIRALARDLGRDLGVGGHLIALRRTRVGDFTLSEASDKPIPMIDVARRAFPYLEVGAEQARDIRYGRKLDLSLHHDLVALIHDNEFLALYARQDHQAAPVAVLV